MSILTVLKTGAWLSPRRLRDYPRLFLLVYLLIGLLWVGGLHQALRPDEGAVVTDFENVYVAGQAVHEGAPEKAYDWPDHARREAALEARLGNGKRARDAGTIPWLYPPPFLAVAAPLARLPYYGALAVYSLLGLAIYAFSLRRLLPKGFEKQGAWLAASFPGVFINLFSGQNGFLTMGLLAFGLGFLETSPWLAGLCLGFLVYKPQFFVLIPLALLVGRYWKAFFATCLSSFVCLLLSLVAFGLPAWLAFVQGLPATRTAVLENGGDKWMGILHSVFSAVRVFGGSLPLAYGTQTAVSVVAVLALLWLWARRDAAFAAKGSALVAVLLLASPYSFVYDQVVLAIALVLMAGQGLKSGFLPYEKSFMAALWLLPFLVRDSGPHFALPLTPPLLLGLLGFALAGVRKNAAARPISSSPECR